MKQENDEKILLRLKDKPKRFTDLIRETKLSQQGLTGVLKRLKESKLIEISLVDGKPAYTLTEIGIAETKSIWSILHTIAQMAKDKDSGEPINYANFPITSMTNTYRKQESFPGKLFGDSNTALHVIMNGEDLDICGAILGSYRTFFQDVVKNMVKLGIEERDLSTSKVICAFEFDLATTIRELHNIQTFITCVKKNENVFGKNGFKYNDVKNICEISEEKYILSTLSDYAQWSLTFGDIDYEKTLDKYVVDMVKKYKTYIFSDMVNKKAMDKFITCVNQKKNPFKDKDVQKAIIKRSRGASIIQTDYFILLARLLKWSDKQFRENLSEFEIQQMKFISEWNIENA